MLNSNNRKFSNEDYKNFIRKLPCAITGKAGDNVHPHHVFNISLKGIVNDYYCIPLIYYKHIRQSGHITREQLEKELNEDPRDLIIFYLSLYAEYLRGQYDPEMDREINFLTLRRKKIGKE